MRKEYSNGTITVIFRKEDADIQQYSAYFNVYFEYIYNIIRLCYFFK